MGYVIRQTTTGMVCVYSSVFTSYFHDPVNRNPYIFSDLGHAKAAITRALKIYEKNRSCSEQIRELCLGLEVVEVTESYSVSYGAVVFSQLFRANEI